MNAVQTIHGFTASEFWGAKMRDRSEWRQGVTGPVQIGRKRYPRLAEFSRPCVACKQRFSIYVTEKIAEGLADSNNFGLKNCEEHRRGGNPAELDSLRSKDKVMSDELSGLYETIRELRERLAKHELRTSTREKMPWE